MGGQCYEEHLFVIFPKSLVPAEPQFEGGISTKLKESAKGSFMVVVAETLIISEPSKNANGCALNHAAPVST